MDYIFLADFFYSSFPKNKYPEIASKIDRPYAMLRIEIEGIKYAIPFRSNIRHKHALFTDKDSNSGLDFSKSIVVTTPDYIDKTKSPHIRSHEFNFLKSRENRVINGMKKFISEYQKALLRKDIERNKRLCEYSPLKYFHKELNIEQE